MLKPNAKNMTMKRLIFIISIIFISCQLTAQTNNTAQTHIEKSSKKIRVSELKKRDFNDVRFTSMKKETIQKRSEKSIEPKEKIELKPKQESFKSN